MTQWIYAFGNGKAQGSSAMSNILGGKGANLAEMSSLGISVPPGFTITTQVCDAFYKNDQTFPEGLDGMIQKAILTLNEQTGRKFGGVDNPLLVSVRSGARASMPGMMDTVLNLGLNDTNVIGLARQSNDEKFAYDSYRRFIQMYSSVALGLEHYLFEEILDEIKNLKGVQSDIDLTAEDFKTIVEKFKALVQHELGVTFPQDPEVQLKGAIEAVFKSWMNTRAVTYRRLYNIPESWGTAVNIQSMVFGNMGVDSCTGVVFTREPSTGEKLFFGEYLINAQGEDVVAGIRTPVPVNKRVRDAVGSSELSMEESMPELYAELVNVYQKLELHYRDMQDIEFTVERGKLYILQTRNGKRTITAAIKIVIDMYNEGLITQKEAIMRIDPMGLEQLLHQTLDQSEQYKVVARGLPASPGAASGIVVFSADDAEREANMGKEVILVRIETSPEDIHGMHVAKAILTIRGGMTSHAAVVARSMGTPCVSGASEITISYQEQHMMIGNVKVLQGDYITLDGSAGEVILGKVPVKRAKLSDDFNLLMSWADKVPSLKVRANADTPHEVEIAKSFGAQGIGLCRTEHMFFDVSRINVVRQMILSDSQESRLDALTELLPMQRQDFENIFRTMDGLPVTIRLLDPPLHEFLPQGHKEIIELAHLMEVEEDVVRYRVAHLKEINPMLGHRGCRLGISYPEIYQMQVRAIFEAALNVSKDIKILPEIMIPFIATKAEFDFMKELVTCVADDIFNEAGAEVPYLLGAMIELPRAALFSGKIAESSEFFSYGTNDLTQTTLGISRDDSAHFLQEYQKLDLLSSDPFVSIDQEGVGELIEISVERSRKVRKEIKLGVCGEHGGDPASIEFFHHKGLDYVSCSPYRIPIARLAAAHAALKSRASQHPKKDDAQKHPLAERV